MKKLLILFLFFALGTVAHAAETDGGEEAKGSSGLPLPRFASLRVNEVNLRTGPGMRYPIDWVFIKQGLPVEITAEYDIWRRVRDSEGTEGWVHKAALTGKRAAIVTGAKRDMRKDDEANAPVVAHLEVGAIGQILSCKPVWCRVKFGDIKGYLRKTEFWGAYATEVFD